MQWRGVGRCALVGWMRDLEQRLRLFLPANVGLGLGSDAPLWKGEELPHAIPARLAEFSAGRAAARAAIGGLGLPLCAIPMGADRAPEWPSGVIGSISHCAGACMAIAARTEHFQGLGLDLEPAIPLPADLWDTVLRPEERQVLDPLSDRDGLMALRIFVAKEAAYKAQYPRSRQLFDFQTLLVSVSGDRFTAHFQRNIPGFRQGSAISGHLVSTAKFQGAFCSISL